MACRRPFHSLLQAQTFLFKNTTNSTHTLYLTKLRQGILCATHSQARSSSSTTLTLGQPSLSPASNTNKAQLAQPGSDGNSSDGNQWRKVGGKWWPRQLAKEGYGWTLQNSIRTHHDPNDITTRTNHEHGIKKFHYDLNDFMNNHATKGFAHRHSLMTDRLLLLEVTDIRGRWWDKCLDWQSLGLSTIRSSQSHHRTLVTSRITAKSDQGNHQWLTLGRPVDFHTSWGQPSPTHLWLDMDEGLEQWRRWRPWEENHGKNTIDRQGSRLNEVSWCPHTHAHYPL